MARRKPSTAPLSEPLLRWYSEAKRDLPWRRTREPWLILLSEVMLQQTRVAAVLPYYARFTERFPTPASMADAPESEVLALWAGLGYYSRARNLQKAARAIVAAGGFPYTLEGLRALPGVGDYTAAAIASISYALPHVVVDGNVLRVMSRLTADRADIRATATKARLRVAAQSLLPADHAADFNQALMELGATVCLPRNPQCLLCPWRDACQARSLGIQGELPIKLGRREPVAVSLHLLLIRRRGRIFLWQRAQTERRMAGFWELPEAHQLPQATTNRKIAHFTHSITNHRMSITISEARCNVLFSGGRWLSAAELESFPLSTITRKALRHAAKL